MKYTRENQVDAVYTKRPNGLPNPYAEAMPEMLSKDQYFKEIASLPEIPQNYTMMGNEERRALLAEIYKFFYPMDYMYYVYDTVYRAILESYESKSVTEAVSKIYSLHEDYINRQVNNLSFITQSYSGSLLGVPGIGKTSTIKKTLKLIPQVIVHRNYNGTPMYFKQITHLFVECPMDCSVKTLVLSIIAAVDEAIGSHYYMDVNDTRMRSTSALVIKTKIICLNHRVGIIVIDEMQNVITAAYRDKRVSPLIKFLVELTNDTCVSVLFSGTLLAEDLFSRESHLKRRTRGYRLLPMKKDRLYYSFLSAIWKYQVVLKKEELTDAIINGMYDMSSGIPSYIVKIFVEAQAYAILSGEECLSLKLIKETLKVLQIDPPKVYDSGISLSDFSSNPVETDGRDLSFLSKKKGRPVIKRDELDLLVIFEKAEDEKELEKNLCALDLIEYV